MHWQVASRRVPGEARLIEQPMDGNGDFRDICEELADAEMALAAIDTVPAALREARTVEWQG